MNDGYPRGGTADAEGRRVEAKSDGLVEWRAVASRGPQEGVVELHVAGELRPMPIRSISGSAKRGRAIGADMALLATTPTLVVLGHI